MNARQRSCPARRRSPLYSGGSVGDAKGGHLLKALQIMKNLLFSFYYIYRSDEDASFQKDSDLNREIFLYQEDV